MSTTSCPGCGAHNRTTTRRCTTCGRVINRAIPELERGLAALHPDRGFGTSFSASWGRGGAGDDHDGAHDDGHGRGHDDQVAPGRSSPAATRRWTSSPIVATIPPWEPTRDGLDDESVELASTIVLDAPLRNGPTPPPLEYEVEHFDPAELDWHRPY